MSTFGAWLDSCDKLLASIPSELQLLEGQSTINGSKMNNSYSYLRVVLPHAFTTVSMATWCTCSYCL